MAAHSLPIEINASKELRTVTFSTLGERLWSGGVNDKVGVWEVQDGQRVATMEARSVLCLAASQNGRWVAGGDLCGRVFVWDAKEFNTYWWQRNDLDSIHAVDFSADSDRLVSGSFNRTATIWDVSTGQKVHTLHHEERVIGAKYSQEGDRIATATDDGSIQVWNSEDGNILVSITMTITPLYNNGLVWFNNYVLVISGSTIKQLDASTGSPVSEWPAANSNQFSRIVLPKHGKFIAYSTNRAITFRDTLSNSVLGHMEHPEEIYSIALSPCDRSLAIGDKDGKITIRSVSRITDSIPLARLHPTLQEPGIEINNATLDAWKHGRLEDADGLLTTAIQESHDANHDLLAARALVRARLGYLDPALFDAKTALGIRPSIIAFIAKSIAHVGKREISEAYRTCDIAFEHFHTSHISLLLVIKAVIVFMAGSHHDAISRMDDLIAAVPLPSTCYIVQACMHLLRGNMYMERNYYESAIISFQCGHALVSACAGQVPILISLISGWTFHNLHITMQQRLCEALHAAGRKIEAKDTLRKILRTIEEEAAVNESSTKWVSSFTERCLSAEVSGDTVQSTTRDTAALPHKASTTWLLKEWAKAKLAYEPWSDALRSAVGFSVSKISIFRCICERLETIGRRTDASDCLRHMVFEWIQQPNPPGEATEWALQRLESLGDIATSAELYDNAISHYTDALTLDPAAPQHLLLKRSKAYVAQGSWEGALNDAKKVIELDPMSPWGYERKHAALHRAGDYRGAVDAFKAMLRVMSQSPEEEISALQWSYVNPTDTRATIQKAIQDAIRDSPRVLINTITGQLCDKPQQAALFETLPVFYNLISSMTTSIDHDRIEQDVQNYYRYAMFSHKWEDNEPLFDQVVRIVVQDLEGPCAYDKLKMFCKIVLDAELHWAWSDTCCINKGDNVILQEALVAMFKWYQGSALMIVFLLDVLSPSRRGDLTRSIWNTRAWTFQEYHASKVVRFYTRDWKLYLNLDIPNHKESSEIISEMEEATGVSAQALTTLRPGLDDIREKLCLASTRKTTLVEDTAYSLLGIFSMSMPVVYGEGDQSLGRLLAQLLTSSGDTGILAWTGRSGSFNSCLPTAITVFKELSPLHIPSAIGPTEMEKITNALRASSLNVTLATNLYDQLQELPLPLFAGQRLKLPCLVFKLGAVSLSRNVGERVFRAQTDALGVVEIGTEQDLSRFSPLYLVHPWIDFLLDRQPVGGVVPTILDHTDMPSSPLSDTPTSWSTASGGPGAPIDVPMSPTRKLTARLGSRFSLPFSGLTPTRATLKDASSLLPPSTLSEEDKQRRAFCMMARLKQPFGALLLVQNPGKVAALKRVATETLIMLKLEEVTPAVLNRLVSSVRVLDVL